MVKISKLDKIDVVSFSVDRINALVSDEIRDMIGSVFETAHSNMIIDLSGINYIDSSGFGCFLSVMRAARNNYGTLKFARPEPAILELLRTLHLYTVFQIYEDMDSCVRSFN